MPVPSIAVTSVLVDRQEKALRFCTDVLEFAQKRDLPAGDARWLHGRLAGGAGRRRAAAGAE
jgi:hypothetical protein